MSKKSVKTVDNKETIWYIIKCLPKEKKDKKISIKLILKKLKKLLTRLKLFDILLNVNPIKG